MEEIKTQNDEHFSTTLSQRDIKPLISGEMADPFTVLGAHLVLIDMGPALAVRALLPGARSVVVLDLVPDQEIPAPLVDEHGLFEAVLPGERKISPYRLKVDFGTDPIPTFYDCYSFGPVLTEDDLFLFGEGNFYEIYEKLGAHIWQHQGIMGTFFAVWAPSASRVSVVGDFNQSDNAADNRWKP